MTLQIALLIIGVIVVALVVIVSIDKSRMSRRRYRIGTVDGVVTAPSIEETGQDTPIPVLTSRLDINPDAQTIQKKTLSAAAEAAPVKAPAIDPGVFEELEELEQAAAMTINSRIDPRFTENEANDEDGIYRDGHQTMANEVIDFIVNLPGHGPVSRNRALGVYKQNEYMLEKPRHIYGLRNIAGLWSDLERDPRSTEYTDLSLAIQMVDKNGPIDESELNTFVQLALKLADKLHRPTKFSVDFDKALDWARQLDGFCRKHDVIASINVEANSEPTIKGQELYDAATRQGLEPGPMDIFHKKNDASKGCRHQFSMANMFDPGTFSTGDWQNFRTQGVTLFMYVPKAHEPVRVFDNMVLAAQGIAGAVGGKLTDQEHKPLTDNGINVIRQQIEQIAIDMASNGIYPGSEIALRLFE